MKTYAIFAVVLIAVAGYILKLVDDKATQRVALDNLARTVQVQTAERKRAVALNIKKIQENQRLATELEAVKDELETLPGSKAYQQAKQVDLPAGYNEHIKRLRDAARGRERDP